MPTTNKPHSNVEWVPIIFILSACYIVTLLSFVRTAGDAVVQGAIGIATTFSGAAAGAYAGKFLGQRSSDSSSPVVVPPPPPDPVPPTQ